MKTFLVLITVFTLFTLASCGPAKQDSGQTQQVPVVPPTQEQPVPVNTEPDQPAMAEKAEQHATEQNNQEVMLNPPHGEPYHRCDIPVGAPLNASSANTPGQATEPKSAEVMINPPHGEPNHRCDIPVGAPLDSPPANNPVGPTIENARRMNSSQTRSTTIPATGTKPRLNPPHGQPWHRCDIAVGSPLP